MSAGVLGLSEFSLRMLSEGRFQSIAWTRNSAEVVLVTQLLKDILEMKALLILYLWSA